MSVKNVSNQENSSNQQLNESLSALMDGEASELELRRILKANGSAKDSLDERWVRYHLASDALKDEVSVSQDEISQALDLSASISAAIADEPTYSVASASKKGKTSFWSNLGRFAVAASVAGAVVVGVQFSPNNTGNQLANTPAAGTDVPANVASQPELGGDTSVRVVGNQAPSQQQKPIVLNEATQEQLRQMEGEINRLMLEHAQDGAQNTQQGVLPYVRVPDAEQ